MELINDIAKKFLDRHEKYIYYIVALCVASIGFSVYITIGKPLSRTYILLGLAVSSWGISIFCGLKFLTYSIAELSKDQLRIRISNGDDPKIGKNPTQIAIALARADELMKLDEKFAAKLLLECNGGSTSE